MWHYYNSVLWSLYVSVYLQICDSRADSSDTPGCILALRTWMKWFMETKGRWWKYLRVWIHISYTLGSRGGGLRHWGPSISLVPCHYWHFFSARSLRRNLDLLQQNHRNNNLNFQLDCLLNKKLHLMTLFFFNCRQWGNKTTEWCWTFATAWIGTNDFISRKCHSWFVKHLTTYWLTNDLQQGHKPE